MESLTSNFEHIIPILSFEDGYFYYAQIIQRRKDIPDLPKTRIVLRDDVIPSLEYLESHMEFWMKFCQVNNARMYINVNRKRYDLTSYMMVEQLSVAMRTNQFGHIPNIFKKAAFRTPTDKRDQWLLIDIDEKDLSLVNNIQMWLDSNWVESYHLPTKNGYHVISKKFNTQKFKDKFDDMEHVMDIKKNSPTLLIF